MPELLFILLHVYNDAVANTRVFSADHVVAKPDEASLHVCAGAHKRTISSIDQALLVPQQQLADSLYPFKSIRLRLGFQEIRAALRG
jgi:hypothetical protein